MITAAKLRRILAERELKCERGDLPPCNTGVKELGHDEAFLRSWCDSCLIRLYLYLTRKH